MLEKCPLCGENLKDNKCPFCGYVHRKATWSQQTTACEKCLTPEVPLTEEQFSDPEYETEEWAQIPEFKTEDRAQIPEFETEENPKKPVHNHADYSFSVKTTTVNGKPITKKSSLLVLTVFFGWSGIQRFITGKYILGFLYLFTFGIHGIGWIVDIILVATGRFKDRSGRLITQ